MKAIIVYPKRRNSAELTQIPEPLLGEDEVLVRVLEVGIDGTDRDIQGGDYGEPPTGLDYLVMGHEALGTIEKMGERAKSSHLNVGDLVVGTVRRPDGCPNCLVGEMDMCLWGNYTERGIKGAHGYLSEYYTEKPEFLIPIPRDLAETAVLLEPLSVVEKAISQAWRIQKRMHWWPGVALVLGAGPIGILATLLLRLRGITTYVYSRQSSSDDRAGLIRALGAEYISSEQTDLSQLAKQLGRIDFILEATGNGAIALHSFGLLGENGVLALTSISSHQRKLEVCPDCINLNLVLGNRLVFGSVNSHRRDFEASVDHIREAQDRFPGFLNQLITHKVRLIDYRQALEKRPNEIKTIITVAENR